MILYRKYNKDMMSKGYKVSSAWIEILVKLGVTSKMKRIWGDLYVKFITSDL